MDEAVAFHILEWRHEQDRWIDSESGDAVTELPRFSSDLSAAWRLAKPICAQGFRLQLDGSRIWQARFYKSAAHTLETRAFAATAKNPAEAICVAALAVMGVGD